MIERPIIMKKPMAGSILADLKDETRRLVHPQPVSAMGGRREGELWLFENFSGKVVGTGKCPYGVPGDRLWVKENFWQLKQAPEGAPLGADLEWVNKIECVRYADYDWANYKPAEFGYYLRPSIYMARWASRILLEITDIRVECVKDITEEGARAEGVERVPNIGPCRVVGWKDYGGGPGFLSAVQSYASLWDSINGAKYPWKSNPIVWVIQFKRLK